MSSVYLFFFFNDTATTEIYTLSLHDALPISSMGFGENAGTPRARTARVYHQRSPAQAAGRWRLESVFTRRDVETSRRHTAGSEERRVRHRPDHVGAATGGPPPRERPLEARAVLVGA